MAPNRNGALAAVWLWAVIAGTIAARKGSATAAPMVPRKNVRRDRCFFVMIIAPPPSVNLRDFVSSLNWTDLGPHLERHALDDPHDDRLEAIVVLRRVLHDAPDNGHIGGFEPPAQRVDQQVLGHRADNDIGPAEARLHPLGT